MCRQTQDLDDVPWSFPHKLLRLELRGLKGSLGNGKLLLTDKIKEQINSSDQLVWFSGADLPHSQNPLCMTVPNTSFLWFNFQAASRFLSDYVSHKSLPYCQLCLGLKAFSAASALTQWVVEAEQSVMVSLAEIKGFCKWHNA